MTGEFLDDEEARTRAKGGDGAEQSIRPLPAPTPEARGESETTRVRVGQPSEILPIVPLMLGFQPADGDLVMMGMSGRGRLVVTARFAAAEPRMFSDEALQPILHNVRAAGANAAILIGYGPGEIVTPTMDRMRTGVSQHLELRDALRVEGDRFWSYHCVDPQCCPPEGRQFAAETEATTALRTAGLYAAASRESVADQIAGPTGEKAAVAREALEEARRLPLSLRTGRQVVERALATIHEGRRLGDAEVAKLAVALGQIPVRDHAWSRMTRDRAEQHLEFWADIVRRLPNEAVAAPASLLAWTSWQTGRGALANLALDRVQQADPDYSLAELLRAALTAGLSPELAEPPMTPAEVERAYGPEPDPEIGS